MDQQPRSTTSSGIETDATPVISGVIIFVLCAVFLVAPRSSPVLLGLLAIVLSVNALQRHGWRGLHFERSPLLIALIISGIYLLLNASWSVAPGLAYGKAALYFLILAFVMLGQWAIAQSDKTYVDRLSFNILLATGIFGAYLAIEILFAAPIERTLFSYIPMLQPSQKHITVTDGWVESIGPYLLNRNIAVLTLLLWPTLLIIRHRKGRQQALIMALGLAAITLVTIAFSKHETSMLALAASLVVFTLAHFHQKTAMWLTATGWVIATLLIIPIALSAFSQQMHFSKMLPSTAQARIIIWNHTAEQVKKRPFLGVGLQSTKPLDVANAASAKHPKGFAYPLRTGRHSHNVYIQTWYELGAVGALLLCITGALIIRRISTYDPSHQPYALATFAAVATIAASSWGMWQPWFMAAFAIAALIFTLAEASTRFNDKNHA